MEMLPVLAQREDMRIVEVDGQPVVIARDLTWALGYAREDAIRRLLNRNRASFKEYKGDVNLTPPLKGQIGNSELKYDTGVVEIDTPGGLQQVRYFTKRGALKICMKSNQPKAVQVQESLIDLCEQVERGELVSIGYLSLVVQSLRQEINRLSDIVTAASIPSGIPSGPQVIYLPRPYRRHSFDDEALAFLQDLFNRKPRARIAELERQLRRESVKECWKVGSRASVYRAIKSFREKEICVV